MVILNDRPILVTGSHRSGSTWAGQMLSLNERVAYIHEPFNVSDEISINPKQFDVWFKYISLHNSEKYEKIFQNIIKFNYPFAANIQKCKTIRHFAKLGRDQALSIYFKSKGCRPLIKDPIALFSAEWLAEKFNMDVLVMIRHPAAFCSSLKIKGWQHDFNDFLDQPELMDGYLNKFRDDILHAALNRVNVLDQAILLWNCIHHTISLFQTKHSAWIFARHEDLSKNPVTSFESIYKHFSLSFDDKIAEKIVKSTGDHNPTEQVDKNEFVRNSRANTKNWKKRLSTNEIEYIKKRTARVTSMFYHECDW